MFLDLSYNRLDEQALRLVVRFMEDHDDVRVCVGYNNFQFPGFYKVLADMNHTEWVESERIHMGTTEFDRKLDRVAALNMETAGNLNKMHGDVATLLQSSNSLLQSSNALGKTAEVAMHTNAWASNQRDAFELVVTTILKDNLVAKGYTVIDVLAGKHCKLPFHIANDGSEQDATQWDGVLMMEDALRCITYLSLQWNSTALAHFDLCCSSKPSSYSASRKCMHVFHLASADSCGVQGC